MEQAKFTYSLLGKAFEKQLKNGGNMSRLYTLYVLLIVR